MILACVVLASMNGWLSNAIIGAESHPNITTDLSCHIYDTVKEAALAEYKNGTISKAEFYRIHRYEPSMQMKLEKIKAPKVSLEVKE